MQAPRRQTKRDGVQAPSSSCERPGRLTQSLGDYGHRISPAWGLEPPAGVVPTPPESPTVGHVTDTRVADALLLLGALSEGLPATLTRDAAAHLLGLVEHVLRGAP
jgi:hypothetical protein